MKKQYDFSQGIKGKFYVSDEDMILPLYLNKKNREFYSKLAARQNKTLSDIVNALLTKEKDILSQFIS